MFVAVIHLVFSFHSYVIIANTAQSQIIQ